jgi:hypothetical protein
MGVRPAVRLGEASRFGGGGGRGVQVVRHWSGSAPARRLSFTGTVAPILPESSPGSAGGQAARGVSMARLLPDGLTRAAPAPAPGGSLLSWRRNRGRQEDRGDRGRRVNRRP